MRKTAAFLYQYPFLLFVLFVCIVYLPVLLPFFHLKNDLITQNLPTRFVISESLYSGYFPWWNPYIHYGIPQYGDMNNGFWNPVLWIIAKTCGYSIYSITWEEIFYLLIAGWGMYQLIKEFFYKETALLIGLSYLCCGYVVGHLQHFIWITGVAFFPYVLLFFIRVHKNPVVKNFIGGAISIFFFVSSTHPGMIIGAAYFLLFIVLFIFLFRKSVTRYLYSTQFWSINLLLLILGILTSLVVIISNLDVLNLISRGNKLTLEETLMNPTTFQSYLSLFLPLTVHKSNFFNTDISMRNVYGGIGMLIGLLFYFRNIHRRIIIYSLVPLSFFVLLSAGGWFKTVAWHIFPFTGYVRMNGDFACFVLFILFFLAAGGVNELIKQMKQSVFFKKVINTFLLLFTITAFIALASIFITKSSILYTGYENSGKAFIKELFEKSSFEDLLLIQSIIQLLTVWLIKKNQYNYYSLVFICSLNLIIITWLSLPYTGLGMKSKVQMQQVINSIPRGIQLQELTPVRQTKFIEPDDKREFVMVASYSKKIGNPEPDDYPIQLNSNLHYFNDSALTSFINRQAWLFLSTDTTVNASTDFKTSSISVTENGPGKIKCVINNTGYNYLVLLQNNYRYWEATIDGNRSNHFTAFKSFITLAVPKGTHKIEFTFNPKPIKKALWINCFVMLALLLCLGNKNLRNKPVFK